MAAQQQALIIETLVSLKKAVKRKVYESDSDSSIEHDTNRGNKLKKRARFVRKGHLSAQATGHTKYKEIAEHAGHQRPIISRHGPLVDEEGYAVDSDDDEDDVQDALARRDEENPYSCIQIERLLAPLASMTDLPTHPTLSRPFTSEALTELTTQARALMHKEKAVLCRLKRLFTQLQGDSTWAPCGLFIGPHDHDLFSDTMRFLPRSPRPSANGESSTHAADQDEPADAEAMAETAKAKEDLTAPSERNGALALMGIGSAAMARHRPHDSLDHPFIHPLFKAPLGARPDSNLGLPPDEAEELRRTVQLFVQRREETCSETLKLYEGLLKVDRLRRTVLDMAKAEAHCGPNRDLSDGEDWYDRDAWGLTEDLKKGQDEEEEDTTQQQQQQQQQKKTRNRR